MANFTFCLLLFLALHFVLYPIHKSFAIQCENPEESNHFHTVEVSSLLTAPTRSPSPTVSSEEGFMKLVHRYGPCSPIKHGKADASSVHDILKGDQIKMMFKKSWPYGKNGIRASYYINGGEYVVNVGIGTPKRELTLIMDTGSSLLWTQCRPCKLGPLKGCFKQRHPIFEPLKSSTYTNIKCPTHTCSQAGPQLGRSYCLFSTCVYETAYLDGSGAAGILAKERISVGSNVFNNIIVGCTHGNINMSFVGTDGILGLGQDFVSFVEQTANTYHKVFSYCLPSKSSEIGFLRFGKAKPVSKFLKFTQLGAGYTLNLVGIKLGGTKLPITIKKGAASIDSGSSTSILPQKDYITLRDAYRKAMSRYKLVVPEDDILDTCYNISSHQKLVIPKMSLLFADGLELDVPHYGIAWTPPTLPNIVCLPFGPNPLTEEVLLGNPAQKTLEIVYDSAAGKIGFGYGGCK